MSVPVAGTYNVPSEKSISGRDFSEVSGWLWTGKNCDPVVPDR